MIQIGSVSIDNNNKKKRRGEKKKKKKKRRRKVSWNCLLPSPFSGQTFKFIQHTQVMGWVLKGAGKKKRKKEKRHLQFTNFFGINEEDNKKR